MRKQNQSVLDNYFNVLNFLRNINSKLCDSSKIIVPYNERLYLYLNFTKIIFSVAIESDRAYMSSRTKMLNLQQQMSRHNSWISIIFDKNCVWTINLWDPLKGIIWSQHTFNKKKPKWEYIFHV